MKTSLILLCAVSLACGSCSNQLTPAQQAEVNTEEVNLLKDGTAAVVGYAATGTPVGAAAAAGAQVVKNHLPATTAAKAPVAKSVLP